MAEYPQSIGGLGQLLGGFLGGGGQQNFMKGQMEGMKIKAMQDEAEVNKLKLQSEQKKSDMAQDFANQLFRKSMARNGGGSGGMTAGGGGGLAGMSPNDVAAYAIMGGSGADSVANLYKWTKEGIKRDAGSYYENAATGETSYMPKLDSGMSMGQNGQVMNTPGYTSALEGQEHAKARANNWLDEQKQVRSAQLDDRTEYDPATGNMINTNRLNTSGNGYPGRVSIAKPSEAAQAITLEQAKYNEAQRQSLITDAGKSAKQLARVNQLDALIQDGLKVGGLAPVYQNIGGIIDDIGINVDGLSDLQKSQKIILQLAQDIPLPSGPASNADVQNRIAQLPNITDSPKAFADSVAALRDLAYLSMDVSEYAQEHGYTPQSQAVINNLYAEWGRGEK